MLAAPARPDAPASGSLISLEEGRRAYARLKAEVEAAGILRRSLLFYAAMSLFTFVGYALSCWLIYAARDYLLIAAGCLGFTFFSVQFAGLMHDSGHRAIFASNRLNSLMGVICSVPLGMVFDNWRTRHNAHHAHSNRLGKDPDIKTPMIAVHEDLLGHKGALERAIMRWQAFYFHLFGSLIGFSNRLGTITYFLPQRRAPWQFALYLGSTIFLFVSPFLLFDLPKALFVFLLVHLSSGLYLAACFAPNHKGMQVIDEDQPMSFIEQQVVTSRNVAGGFLTDIFLVGLNWQTEHHLFPACPRNKLPRIAPYLKATCADLGIPYTSVSLLETNRVILRALDRVGRSPALRAAADTSQT